MSVKQKTKFETSQARTASKVTGGPYSMTAETLEDRLEHENPGRYHTQLYAGVVASVSSISFGALLGWSSPTIRQILDDSEGHLQTEMGLASLASLGPLGCAFGVIVWSYFSIKLGPRKAMLIQSPLLITTWLVLAFVLDYYYIALAGRFFCGFFAISYRICSETLLVDSVHSLYLPTLFVFYQSFRAFGVFIAYVIGYNISDVNFSICNCCIVLVHFLMILICPESPVYLYDVNIKKAEAALQWYRGRDNFYIEMRNIKKNSEIRKVDPSAYKYMLFSKVVVKAIIIVMVAHVAQVFSGHYVFLYYNMGVVKKFSTLNVTELMGTKVSYRSDVIDRTTDSMILGLTMFISSFISTWLHFRVTVGVKKPLLISISLVCVNLLLIAAYFFLREKRLYQMKQNSWVYLVLVNTLVICHEIGLSCCPDIMLIEYLPSQVYPRAKLLVKFCQWTFIFLVTKMYFHIQSFVRGWGAMIFQACILLLGLIYIAVFAVESKGKTLVQVQTALGCNPIGTRFRKAL